MSKICCVENDVSPKASSCSMILRSACSHGHSHENLSMKERSSSSHKRKHNSSIASKSSKSRDSLLNGQFHNTVKINHEVSQQVLEVSSFHVSCAKELNFSQLSLSDSQDSYTFKNLNHTECSSDYCSATESDINSSESLNSTSDMNTRRYVRSPHPSVRALSDSEDESEIKVERITRLTRRSLAREYNNVQSYGSQRQNNKQSHNHASFLGNHSHSTNSHSNKYTGTSDGETVYSYMTDSSHLDTSFVQNSLLDRLRLLSWKYNYTNIVRYLKFDLYLFQRIQNFGKAKFFLFLLLPLIFCLVCGAYHNSLDLSEPLSSVTTLASTVISYFLSFLSSIFSYIYILFTRKAVEDEISESDESEYLTFLPSLSSFGALFSGWVSSAIVETKYDLERRNHHLKEDINLSQSGTEELLALNKLKDELMELKSSFQQMEADKLKYQKLHSDLQLKFEAMSKTIDTKEKDYVENYQKEKRDTDKKILAVTNEYKNHMDILKNKLNTLESKLSVYEDLKKCCSKQWNQEDLVTLMERNIILAFKEVISGDINSKYSFFGDWLNSKFFNHEKLMQEINVALKEQSSYTEATVDFSKVLQVVESTVMKHVDILKKNLSEFNNYSYSTYSQDFFSEDKIKRIVKDAIMIYDADKTGQVDYALESGGGSVLGTRCSETYVEKYGKITLFGVPFWTYSNSPRTAIQPDVQPGRCWAFKGSQGFLVLQLSATVYPTGFTLEHIPVSLSPAGSIDSAPKNFSVWGLDSEKDNRGNLLGEYFYDIHGDPLQNFVVKIPSNKPYSYIELQIHSNHGNMDYTCLYRFRVHGKRAY